MSEFDAEIDALEAVLIDALVDAFSTIEVKVDALSAAFCEAFSYSERLADFESDADSLVECCTD